MEREATVRDRVRSEIEALIELGLKVTPKDRDALSDAITTAVMESASPGEVRSVESVEATLSGHACRFQTVYPNQRERTGFYSRVDIPSVVAAALQTLVA